MLDLNVKVCKEKDSEIVGNHELGNHNERGEKWFQRCTLNYQAAVNIWFKKKPRSIWSRRSLVKEMKYKIYNITINFRFRNTILH